VTVIALKEAMSFSLLNIKKSWAQRKSLGPAHQERST